MALSMPRIESEDFNNLFNMTMRGKWEEVVKIYERDPSAHKVRVTKTGGTALHVAVTEDKEEIVSKLVEVISKYDKEALKVPNHSGYTPLHHAASNGSRTMCKCIAEAYPSLVDARTKNTETPLFIAALHGKRGAFFYLHSICSPNSDLRYSYTRRPQDGTTILHAAIDREYFHLAYQIIYLYEDLVDSVNENGLTPLHILATKSSAYKSGSNAGLWKRLIYECIIVKKLKADPSNPQSHESEDREINIVEKLFSSANEQEGSSATDVENPARKDHTGSQSTTPSAERNRISQADYGNFLLGFLLIILGMGSKRIVRSLQELKELKKKHKWSFQVMNELFDRSKIIYKHVHSGADRGELPPLQEEESDLIATVGMVDQGLKTESIVLIAAKNGVSEIVERILNEYPVAIQDRNEERKNILVLAAENRQASVYNLLISKDMLRESIIRKVDRNQNSVLHVAAVYSKDKPWPIPGVAFQMQWEIKWFQFVKASIPPGISLRPNSKNETPEEVFSRTHEDLVNQGREWLIKTSESCSVVAALIAGVGFATSAAIPGGTLGDTGKPVFENAAAFDVFSISSLIALCFSVTALVMFLAILSSRFQEKDFDKDLPGKLLLGLSSLFVSIGAMLVSFCAGHFLMVEDKFKYAAFPVYAITCLPASIFAAAQFPLYFDLVQSTFKNPFDHLHRYK
ncbi:uncharacterized protein LOC107426391 isoform X1 [Ziziphus jujuba]|uniref:Uncharacterized protein LOC107426391 isoform X1 n=1 Tax=Ziziphus jujuba TaxID=326968 RepID=A0A6P4AB46_ZIZJJ|nr:uncharacterized protein LOC107426391 isoform X1 [Ziziphus jujuba]